MIKIAPKLLDDIRRKFNSKSKKQKVLIYSGGGVDCNNYSSYLYSAHYFECAGWGDG